MRESPPYPQPSKSTTVQVGDEWIDATGTIKGTTVSLVYNCTSGPPTTLIWRRSTFAPTRLIRPPEQEPRDDT